MKDLIFIGGPAGAGKDCLTTALVERGCVEFYSGGYLRERAEADGFVPMQPTREAFVPYWEQVAEVEGEDWLAQAAHQLQRATNKTVIFNGTRIPQDAQYAKNHNGINLYMHAPEEELFRRIIDRQRGDDSTIYDPEAYRVFHEAEMQGVNAIDISGVAALSDHCLPPLPYIESPVKRHAGYLKLADYVLKRLAI